MYRIYTISVMYEAQQTLSWLYFYFYFQALHTTLTLFTPGEKYVVPSY